MLVPNELKAARIRGGYSQKKLAQLALLGETSYSKRENGVVPFTINEVSNIAKILNLSSEEIMKIFFNEKVAFDATDKIS
ncbi:helix-turn-helix transcriptional regulator [Clostridium grantii]|uniref:DNA-binding transcriptional regulator, XRE-family HTH domain n=1 Tax=Clostridium grantii DSM 8605 TaxID=1121316 RepID=A0A1M5R0K4_9CLOT|nr:helix-turn-helix transcriptional regulator [Clostridium grantii]SHH19977.1 DNA-binding transcriptional regulator, XRE-family HTH domain [Clostridium grantii DSM 8605]